MVKLLSQRCLLYRKLLYVCLWVAVKGFALLNNRNALFNTDAISLFNTEAKTVEQLRAQLALIRVHGANQTKTRRV